MTAPYTLIDPDALDLTSETGQQNVLSVLVANVNTVLDLLNNAGTTVPLLGTGNSGGLLTASQKLTLTGGGNADSLHHHAGGGAGGGFDPTAPLLLAATDADIAGGRVLAGVAGEIALNDLGAGSGLSVGLAPSGAAAGQYSKVTIDSKGRVVSGGSIGAADLPAHTHSASDLNSGTIIPARFGALTIPLTALNPSTAPDGFILTINGGAVVAGAAPSGTGEVNTASNVNTAGVGVFKQKTGVNLELRGIDAGQGITAALIAASNSILLTPDYGLGTNQVARGDHLHDARYYQKSEVDNLVKVLNVATKTASYLATSSDQLIISDTTAGTLTITLPDATTNIGKVIRVKRPNIFALVAAVINAVHIVPAGTDKIDSIYTDWELWDRNEYLVVVATAGNWSVIDASGSLAPIGVGNIGSALVTTVKPQKQYLLGTATVNNGVWSLQGMYTGQTVHLVVLQNTTGINTILDVIGQGRALWPNGILGGSGGAQPAMSAIAGRQDEVYATWNGADTLFSFRGQGYL